MAGLALSLLLMTIEGFTLRYFQVQRHDSMYVALLPCMVFLYRLLLSWNIRPRRFFRSVSTGMYILHPLMIVAVRGAAKLLGQTGILVENSLAHYGAVCAVTFAFSAAFAILAARRRRPEFQCGRAWIELDRSALQYNVSALERFCRRLRPEPAVKAEAYGHGAVLIARELNRMEIRGLLRRFCFGGPGAPSKRGQGGNLGIGVYASEAASAASPVRFDTDGGGLCLCGFVEPVRKEAFGAYRRGHRNAPPGGALRKGG